MRKKGYLINLIIGGVAMLAVTAGAVYGIIKNNNGNARNGVISQNTTKENATEPETTTIAETTIAETTSDKEEETTVSEFKTYSNARFGYTVEYPKDFIITGQPDNGDGAWLENSEGDKLTISGIYNVLNDTVESLTEALSDNCTITEKSDEFYAYTENTGDEVMVYGVKVGEDVIVSYCLTVKEDRLGEYKDITDYMNGAMK